jgi:CIC family chloride channel protein
VVQGNGSWRRGLPLPARQPVGEWLRESRSGIVVLAVVIGAMAGTAFGEIAHTPLPGIAGSPGVYGLIGMDAAFAGAARAPITAVIVLFELTGEYTIILPLMAAIVIATLVSRTLSRDSIYTLKLRRRGMDLDARPEPALLAGLTVPSVVEDLPEPLGEDTDPRSAAHALAMSGHGILPVIGADCRYHGCVTARAVAEALGALVSAQGTGLPVLDEEATELVGWLTHQSLLNALKTESVGSAA